MKEAKSNDTKRNKKKMKIDDCKKQLREKYSSPEISSEWKQLGEIKRKKTCQKSNQRKALSIVLYR